MKKLSYLASVGVVGLATGLWTAPLSASNTEEDNSEDVSVAAQGSFQGFAIQAPNIGEMPDFTVRRAIEALPVPPTPEIIVRDDVGLGGSVDVTNSQPAVVQLFSQRNADGGVFFNCTGTLINPRTILTAAHCLNASSTRSSEAYGTVESGAERTVLVSTGVDSSTRFFNYLGSGASYSEGGVASSTDVIIHSSSNVGDGGLEFPWADIALVALDEPVTDIEAMPLLLSPLTELTHVIQVGYGSFGTATDGIQGIGFLRRIGENMLGAVASPSDLGDSVFPAFAPTANFGFETQAYYFTDFDNPDRTQEQIDGCDFTPFGINCVDIPAVRAIDWFDDDALPNEVATAGGDSGSPLIVDELYDFQVVTAVLSGGFDFFGIDEGYGDISFYNPLYPFFEFITENTPYKYVSAKAGDASWSDPTHWTQDLDPGFFIDDGTGTLINAIPEGSEPGVYEAGPKLGTILGIDISGNSTAPSPFLPPEGTPNFGAETPESSVLLGPGSTGFVPNNTDGTPGVSFSAPAQYFDVLLTRAGRTTVDIDVEIDKLTLDNVGAEFVLPEGRTFSTIIGYEQFNGLADIDGQFDAGLVALFGGLLQGDGTITSPAVFNVSGGIAPGGLKNFGTLTINGDYIQTSGGTLLHDVRIDAKRTVSDLLLVNGDASIAGDVVINARGRTRFGEEFTVLSANSVLGNFDNAILTSQSPLLFAESRVEGGDVIVTVDARKLKEVFAGSGNFESLGAALDTLRFEGRFNEFVGLFDVIDGAGINSLVPTLASLTPTSAFTQGAMATNFAQRFTGQVAQRTLSLHGANPAAAGFTSAGGQTLSVAQSSPTETGQLGFFGTVSGTYTVSAEDRNSGVNAMQESAFTQVGELTLGADLKMSQDLTIGFAMTSIRNGIANNGAARRREDTSISGAVYAAMDLGHGFADGYFGFSRQNLGVERASQGDFSLAYDTASGIANGRQTFGGMRLGYGFDVLPGVEIGPVASVDYIRNDLGGYTEFGAGNFGLVVDRRSFTSVGSKAGVMASLDTNVGRKGRLSAFGAVAYARELADQQDAVTASFFGAPDVPFTIVNGLDPQWVSINAGLDLALGERFNVSLSGTADRGRGPLTNNQGRMSFSWKF